MSRAVYSYGIATVSTGETTRLNPITIWELREPTKSNKVFLDFFEHTTLKTNVGGGTN